MLVRKKEGKDGKAPVLKNEGTYSSLHELCSSLVKKHPGLLLQCDGDVTVDVAQFLSRLDETVIAIEDLLKAPCQT